ncbi:protein SCAI isoform X3 [Rhipicephalus sanguineus]|uniref:protein SCAI isoform X3 n=1 Tax=Rhipicephalus sanguineus TaxID=34632 RepID=UPI001895BA9A|nr:protein SCAI isoform X3 [Rhipicephalus sanguineus]
MQKGSASYYDRLDPVKRPASGGPEDLGQHAPRRMAIMSEIEEQERKIVNEFCHLLEKSKQLFNGLRDLPQYGHKQWQAYFGRTFDVYTKLWKFQQQHRQILDIKYGLKRWQIGEIASKIGQLYYHYYLRTSETNYLNEAFSFYAAIRARGYYSKASKEESLPYSHRSDLMVKKLRYYARFIVVCLLLKKMKLVRDLVRELAKQIDDYTATYEPEDQLEWSLVLGEIKSFIDADNLVNVVDLDSSSIVLSHRLSPLNTPPMEKVPSSHLSLQEILIIGNCCDQVKFSELTLDMFRMLQTLEREPQEDTTQLYDASPAPGRVPFPLVCLQPENGGTGDSRTGKRENPHKYLLYKPTFSQLFVFLASGFKELPPNGVLLLYVSADGSFPNVKHPEEVGYDYGGVTTNSKREPDHSNKRNIQLKDMHCLYPGDLYPYTRKPLFLIMDSDNSHVFQHMPRFFGQPLVALMSPEDVPPAFHDQQHKGNLLTLFLHSPLTALCFVCHVVDVPVSLWDKALGHLNRFMAEASRVLIRSRSIDPAYLQFYGDDFLRLLMLRFIFCHVVLKLHRMFKIKYSVGDPENLYQRMPQAAMGTPPYQSLPGSNYLPRSHPPIPESEVLDHPALQRTILELAEVLDVRSLFSEIDEAD